MTSSDVHQLTLNAGEVYTFHQVSNAMSTMTVWRRGLPRKFKQGYLIRELKEAVWQEKTAPEDEIKDLSYKLRNAVKERDALEVKLHQILNANAQAGDELLKIQRIWRALNNLMNPGR
jgi:hypothetical protein